MTPLPLPPEDLPPGRLTEADAELRRRLEISTSQHFFAACDGVSQSLLMQCGWTIALAEVPILVIYCPDELWNWRVLNHLTTLANSLAQFSPQAKIRIYPPGNSDPPFDLRVDERTVFRDGPSPGQ